jgi:hypothetical protein
LGGEIDMGDAESPGIAILPFKIVQQRPDEAALHWNGIARGALQFDKASAQGFTTMGIEHLVAHQLIVIVPGAALGQVNRLRLITLRAPSGAPIGNFPRALFALVHGRTTLIRPRSAVLVPSRRGSTMA